MSSDAQSQQTPIVGVATVLSICRLVPAAITSLRMCIAEPSAAPEEEAAKVIYNLDCHLSITSVHLTRALVIYGMMSRQPRQLCGVAEPSAAGWLIALARRILEIPEKHAWTQNEPLAVALSEVQRTGAAYHAEIAKLQADIGKKVEKIAAAGGVEGVKKAWNDGMESPGVRKANEEHKKACAVYEEARQQPRPPGWRWKSLLENWPVIRAELVKLVWPNKDQLDACQVEAEWEFHQAQRYCIEHGEPDNRQQSGSSAQPVSDENAEHSSLEQRHIQQIIQAVGDENASRIMAIAHRKDLSGEKKMEEILRLDTRFAAKNSTTWGVLLNVKPDAIRGYRLWKLLQKAKKSEEGYKELQTYLIT